MTKPNMEQLAAAQKANAEVMMALLRTAFNGVERLTALNMAATLEIDAAIEPAETREWRVGGLQSAPWGPGRWGGLRDTW